MENKELLKQLITEGEQVKARNIKSGVGFNYISGEEYTNWIAKCVIFLQRGNYNKEMTERFIAESKTANGNDAKHYDTMMGILKAFDELGEEDSSIF